MASIRRRQDKWQVQIRRLGQRPLCQSFILRRDAEAWARQMEVQADRHELPQAHLDPKILDRITLGELVERYRDEVSARKRGHEVERIVLDAFLRHSLCNRSISQLSTHDFAKYRDERLDLVKPSTVMRQLAPIHHLFEIAKTEWGLPIRQNPIASLKLGNVDCRRERRLRDGEWDNLTQAAKSRKNPFVLPVMRFALATAMRRGEILGMQWRHLDRHNQSLLIPKTKNGHARTIPLTRIALEILEHSGSKQTPQVFPITANAFRLTWQRIKRQAEVDDLRFHDLRHEAISRFFEMGLTVPEVALISGHRDARMLFRYTHPMREQISKKLNQESNA
jgi:integrase